MRTYNELTPAQQKAAIESALTDLLRDICEHGVRFNDAMNHDDLQSRIDKAGEKAEAMRTPWFWHEYILDTCRADLEGMAQAQAEDTLYTEAGEHCRPIPA